MRPPSSNRRSARLLLIAFVASLTSSPTLHAAELWANEDGDRVLSLDTTLKLTALGARAPDDSVLFPDRDSGTGLVRLRLNFTYTHEDWLDAELAYEQRASYQTGNTVSGSRVLPSSADAPYRVEQLDDQISGDDHYSWDHELDRAYFAFHREWGEITIGRQAIGMGRGLFFSAVDIFSPFSPTEVDRDWRRGVDAFRLEYRLSDTSSAEVIAVFGRSWDDSALLGRFRGYFGNVDAEVIFGKRGRDEMIAGAFSAVVGDAAVHLELGLFHTPEEQADGGLFGDDNLVAKAVLGASYTFDVGRGLTLFGEYHYNGFGIYDAEDIIAGLLNPDLQERFLRGDFQIIGRHAVALQFAYPLTDAWSGALLVMGSPRDGSGLITPSVSWSISDQTTLTLSGLIPWGPTPKNGQFNSEYGASATSLFAQLNFYF